MTARSFSIIVGKGHVGNEGHSQENMCTLKLMDPLRDQRGDDLFTSQDSDFWSLNQLQEHFLAYKSTER